MPTQHLRRERSAHLGLLGVVRRPAALVVRVERHVHVCQLARQRGVVLLQRQTNHQSCHMQLEMIACIVNVLSDTWTSGSHPCTRPGTSLDCDSIYTHRHPC